ncbi:hypothetical protein CUMW_141400, partial [Citrus unshiu]
MWHEARRSERKVHDMMDAARKRAQRRAVFLAKRRGDPQQSIQVIGSRSRVYRDDGLYQATEDQQGLIPWNGKQDVLIDRFDGRALLDFIREPTKHLHAQKKSEEEEELEEFVNFERYRDLIKHRRRGFTDEEGLQHVNQELEAKTAAPFTSERLLQAFHCSYQRKLSRKERRKASQIEREREREASRVSGARVLHHDPYREPRRSPTYEAYPRFRRSRSRSRSYSPSYSRRHARGSYSEEVHRSKSRTPKVEYITEFGGSGDGDEPKLEGFSPPPSPPAQTDLLNRPSSGCILEALHVDPASGVSLVKEKSTKSIKPAEKLAETSRLSRRRHSSSRSRSYSRSPPRRRRYSRSPSRGKSSRRNYSRSRSHSRSPRTQSRSPRQPNLSNQNWVSRSLGSLLVGEYIRVRI